MLYTLGTCDYIYDAIMYALGLCDYDSDERVVPLLVAQVYS